MCVLVVQVIENAVFAFKQPPTLVRHIAVTCVVVALTVLVSLLTDCVGIVLELNVRKHITYRRLYVFRGLLLRLLDASFMSILSE